jgi:hypothetical protein
MTKTFGNLNFDHWNLFGICDLLFGILYTLIFHHFSHFLYFLEGAYPESPGYHKKNPCGSGFQPRN